VAEFRPIQPDEWPVLRDLAFAAFEDLDRRQGEPVTSPPSEDVIARRFRHVVETDPGGAWLAEEDGRPVGAGLAILREGLWGLSMLVVHPAVQSAGIGRALLERTLRYGDGARGGIIMSSDDWRALRAYARAGFDMHPAARATGVPRRLELPATVRPGSAVDLGLAEAVDRAVRGAAHGSDMEVMLAGDARMFVVEGRGYALGRGSELYLLAATDDEAGRDLLRAVIATAPQGESVQIQNLTATQGWATNVVLEAGLRLAVHGALFLRGDVGPFRPYLPSSAYL